MPFVLQANQKVTVHVNNEQSRNCCSSRGMSVFAVEVPARTKMVRSLNYYNKKKITTLKMFHYTTYKCAIQLFILNKKTLLL